MKDIARHAARIAQLEYWKREDDVDVTDAMADAAVVAALRQVLALDYSTGAGMRMQVERWLAEFSAPEGRPEPPRQRQEEEPTSAQRLARLTVERFAAGWDEDGLTGVKAPYRWETAARVCLDILRSIAGDSPAPPVEPSAPVTPEPPQPSWADDICQNDRDCKCRSCAPVNTGIPRIPNVWENAAVVASQAPLPASEARPTTEGTKP